jgi:hypothetical protein
MRAILIAALAAYAVSAGAAQAQQAVYASACAGKLPAFAPFDDRAHELWYKRFWTGQCSSGLGFCSSGSPNWNEAMVKLRAQTAPARVDELNTKMCRLGHVVGAEWARDNGIRKIDTRAVSGFYETLRSGAGDSFARLGAVEAKANAMLNGKRR